MILASQTGIAHPDRAARAKSVLAVATAAAVGLLVASTLGTVGAAVVGSALLLLGVPDLWASAAAALAAAAVLIPSTALARQVWSVERHGTEV